MTDPLSFEEYKRCPLTLHPENVCGCPNCVDRRRAASILNSGSPPETSQVFDTDWTSLPVCPNCGSKDHDWWDGLTIQVNDGTEWTYTCGNCDKEVKVTACVDITFSTEIEEKSDVSAPPAV